MNNYGYKFYKKISLKINKKYDYKTRISDKYK